MSDRSDYLADLRYLEPDDIADILNVSRRTVLIMCRSGKIPAIKAGGAWRIPRGALAVLDPTQRRPER